MKKLDLTRKLARQARCSRAAAADERDRVVHEILSRLRRGDEAHLPGLGTFLPGAEPGFRFDKAENRE